MTISHYDHKATGYSIEQAYLLCKAANLAYSEPPAARVELENMGFDTIQFFCSKHEMPFPLEDTQAYIAASDDMIVIAFRGTEPLKIVDWLSDVNLPAGPGPAGKGMVHLGFSRALTCVFEEIKAALAQLRTKGQTVWFTGHSLGGALAMLAGTTIYFDDPKLLPDGIYTFGQPRICDRALATAHDAALKARTFRFINNNDIVPRVPIEPFFRHVGNVKYFDSTGKLHDELPLAASLTETMKGFTADLLAPGTDAIRDHFYWDYLANVAKNMK